MSEPQDYCLGCLHYEKTDNNAPPFSGICSAVFGVIFEATDTGGRCLGRVEGVHADVATDTETPDLDGLICPWCQEESGIEGDWDAYRGSPVKCGACGEWCTVSGDEYVAGTDDEPDGYEWYWHLEKSNAPLTVLAAVAQAAGVSLGLVSGQRSVVSHHTPDGRVFAETVGIGGETSLTQAIDLREQVARAIAHADEQNGAPPYCVVAANKHSRGCLYDQADAAIAAMRADGPAIVSTADILAMTGLLREFLEVHEEPCFHDHHGKCQAHFMERDCLVARTRALLDGGQP